MLSKWRGTARSIAGRSRNRFRLFWSPLSRTRKFVFGVVTLVIVIGVLAGGGYLVNYYLKTRPVGTPLSTPEQAMEDNLKELLATDTSKLTKEEKAQYYNRLSVAQSDAKDYGAAADALKKRDNADPSTMTYYEYIQMALYYHGAGDNKAALQALDKAASVAPKTDDPDNGYRYEPTINRIEQLKKEYGA